MNSLRCVIGLALLPMAATGQVSSHALPQLGGAATVVDDSPNAFGYPAKTLSRKERRRFLVGNSFFKQNWVESPASASDRDGLGPLFNARSCSACHLRDGRSAPPTADGPARHGLLMRIGIYQDGQPDAAHPHYGGQIQDQGVQGVAAEARVAISYRAVAGQYADGTPYELLAPSYILKQPAYGAVMDAATLGPRTAPHLIGLGLLEAVPVAQLVRIADPDDRDGDGISGRVHFLDADQKIAGRFGWKATKATVRGQTAAAYVNDMGITSPVHPEEALSASQLGLLPQGSTATPEIDAKTFADVVFYTQALAVPRQRIPDDSKVIAGQQLFANMGCAACHQPTLATGSEAFHPSYRNQEFHPYTDLLLHDMGPDLADQKRDVDARPREWRTPPLWGLGLIERVSGHTRLLHDGRARNLEEAVLWHGGEGQAARDRFVIANARERTQLLAFLRSL